MKSVFILFKLFCSLIDYLYQTKYSLHPELHIFQSVKLFEIKTGKSYVEEWCYKLVSLTIYRYNTTVQ